MKNHFKYVILLLISFNVNAVTNLRFHTGLDMQLRDMKYGKGYGGELFKQHFPQGNAYATLRLNDYLGLELGYELTSLRTKSTLSGRTVLGITLPDHPNAHISKSGARGWNAGIVGYYPTKDFLGNKLDLIGYVGQVNLKVKSETIFTRDRTGTYAVQDTIRHFVKHKHLLKFGVGAQYSFGPAGVRFMVYHEDTRKLQNLTPIDPLTSKCILTFRNSLIWSIGVFLNFPRG